MKTKSIWLVIELGAGVTHKAFFLYSDAVAYVEVLKEQLDYDCFEIHEVEIN